MMKEKQSNRSKLQIIIFSTLLVLILVLLVASIILSTSNRKKVPAENITITNLTDSGATVTWTTAEKTDAKVYIHEKGKGGWSSLPIISTLGKKANYDDRDIDQVENGNWEVKSGGNKDRLTHSVSLRGLKPETEYEFRVGAGFGTFDKDKKGDLFPTFKTLAINRNLGTPDPVYSKVLNLDVGKANPVDGIVYYQLTNPGKLQVTSLLYSTTLSENSSWSGDLSNIVNASGEKFISTKDTIINVSVVNEIENVQASYSLKDYKPLPNLFIDGSKMDGVSLIIPNLSIPSTSSLAQKNLLISSVRADEDCPAGSCEAGGACLPSGSTADKTSNGTEAEPIGTYSCVNGNWILAHAGLPQNVKTINPDKSACYETKNTLLPCEEVYDESCRIGDQLGIRRCHKKGQSPCGIIGPECTWGEGSECDNTCSVDNRKVSEKVIRAEQEAASGVTNAGAARIIGLKEKVGEGVALMYAAAKENICIVFESGNTQPYATLIGNDLGNGFMATEKTTPTTDAEKKFVTQGYKICEPVGSQETSPSGQGVVNLIPQVKAESTTNTTSASDTTLSVTESGKYSISSGASDQSIAEFAVNMDEYQKVEVRLFVDTNKNGKRDLGEPVLDNYSQIKLKKDSDVATYELRSGWNLIALSVSSSEGIDTASELLESFNKQGAEVKHIARYTGTGFQLYTKREEGQEFSNDFDLIPGQGYFVLNYTPAYVSIKGNKFDEAVPFSVQNGWNLVGVYTNEKTYTAEKLLTDMKDAKITADTVSRYDSGMYTSVVYDVNILYGNNFNLIERQGYFVRVENGGGSDVKFTPKP